MAPAAGFGYRLLGPPEVKAELSQVGAHIPMQDLVSWPASGERGN